MILLHSAVPSPFSFAERFDDVLILITWPLLYPTPFQKSKQGRSGLLWS
jgi:hypothetical protein